MLHLQVLCLNYDGDIKMMKIWFVVLSRWETLRKRWWNPWRSSGKSNWARQGYCMTFAADVFVWKVTTESNPGLISVMHITLFERNSPQTAQFLLPSAGQIMCFLCLPSSSHAVHFVPSPRRKGRGMRRKQRSTTAPWRSFWTCQQRRRSPSYKRYHQLLQTTQMGKWE